MLTIGCSIKYSRLIGLFIISLKLSSYQRENLSEIKYKNSPINNCVCDTIKVISASLKSVGVYSLDSAYLTRKRIVDKTSRAITK